MPPPKTCVVLCPVPMPAAPAAHARGGRAFGQMRSLKDHLEKISEILAAFLRLEATAEFEPMPGRKMKGYGILASPLTRDRKELAKWMGAGRSRSREPCPPKRRRRRSTSARDVTSVGKPSKMIARTINSDCAAPHSPLLAGSCDGERNIIEAIRGGRAVSRNRGARWPIKCNFSGARFNRSPRVPWQTKNPESIGHARLGNIGSF